MATLRALTSLIVLLKSVELPTAFCHLGELINTPALRSFLLSDVPSLESLVPLILFCHLVERTLALREYFAVRLNIP
jgi:hypothetical protein